MNLWDILILAALASAVLLAVRTLRKGRTGCCSGCSGNCGACGRDCGERSRGERP